MGIYAGNIRVVDMGHLLAHTHNINISYSSQSRTYISNIGKLKTDQEDHKHIREAQRKDMKDGSLVKMYESILCMHG